MTLAMRKSRRSCSKCSAPCRGPRDARYVKLVLCPGCRRARRREQIREAVQRLRAKAAKNTTTKAAA